MPVVEWTFIKVAGRQLHHECFPGILTHFSPGMYFYVPWKRQQTFGFLTFSGGVELVHWAKMG